MDAQTLTVLLWVATGGAGFVAGLVGLAATKRSMREPSSRDRHTVDAR